MRGLTSILQKVRAVVLRSGVAPQDADDLLQEAFVRLETYTRKQEVRSREAFLVTAAVNLGRDPGSIVEHFEQVAWPSSLDRFEAAVIEYQERRLDLRPAAQSAMAIHIGC